MTRRDYANSYKYLSRPYMGFVSGLWFNVLRGQNKEDSSGLPRSATLHGHAIVRRRNELHDVKSRPGDGPQGEPE
jgi:hypothetical protein